MINNIDNIIYKLQGLEYLVRQSKLTCSNKFNYSTVKYIQTTLTAISISLVNLHANPIALDYIRQIQEIVNKSNVKREIIRRINDIMNILRIK